MRSLYRLTLSHFVQKSHLARLHSTSFVAVPPIQPELQCWVPTLGFCQRTSSSWSPSNLAPPDDPILLRVPPATIHPHASGILRLCSGMGKIPRSSRGTFQGRGLRTRMRETCLLGPGGTGNPRYESKRSNPP